MRSMRGLRFQEGIHPKEAKVKESNRAIRQMQNIKSLSAKSSFRLLRPTCNANFENESLYDHAELTVR